MGWAKWMAFAGLACCLSLSGCRGPRGVRTGSSDRPLASDGVFFDIEVRGDRDQLAELAILAEPLLEAFSQVAYVAGSGSPGAAAPLQLVDQVRRTFDLSKEPQELRASLSYLFRAGAEGLRIRLARYVPGQPPQALEATMTDAVGADGVDGVLDFIRLLWRPDDVDIRLEREDGVWVKRVRRGRSADYRVISSEVGLLAEEVQRRLYEPHIRDTYRRRVREARRPPARRLKPPRGTSFPTDDKDAGAG
ncbi:hypothetical protein ACFL59_00465 [Planctomycetota bacterium]